VTAIAIGDAPRHGPFPGTLDPQSIAAYATATGDHTTAVLSGDAVPVVFPVVLVFQAQEAANADIPDAAWQQATGGVHGEHELVLHRALVRGEALQTWSRLSAVRTTRAGTKVVLHIEQFDSGGALVVEQWWATMLLGLHSVADVGTMPADHRIPDGARAHPLGSSVQHIDTQVARRYAEVSGDWSAHHFDIDAARRTGFDFLFAHGLCTMAICTHHVLALAGVDNPGRVRRAAVRFASPTPLGADLTVSAFGIDKQSVGFEASCNGTNVITHGRLELRD
jgi:acyl dehydratase